MYCLAYSCWRHDMDTLSALLALYEGNRGGFTSQMISDAAIWCFLCRQPKQAVSPAIWDAIQFMWRHSWLWRQVSMQQQTKDKYKILPHWGRVTHIYALARPSVAQIMACRRIDVKSLSEPILPYCQMDPKEYISVKFYLKFPNFHSRRYALKCRSSGNWRPFCLGLNVLNTCTLLFKSNGIFFCGGKIWCLFLRYRPEILCVA